MSYSERKHKLWDTDTKIHLQTKAATSTKRGQFIRGNLGILKENLSKGVEEVKLQLTDVLPCFQLHSEREGLSNLRRISSVLSAKTSWEKLCCFHVPTSSVNDYFERQILKAFINRLLDILIIRIHLIVKMTQQEKTIFPILTVF